jgi:lipopolysaccharide export system protein LptC
MKRLTTLIPVLIAALLALATYWLQFVVSNEHPAGLGNDRGDPDAIVEHFHVDKFNDKGRLAMSLDADELMHYPQDDSADLKQPRVRFVSPGRDSTWRSDKARVTERGDHIQLIDNVRGVRIGTDTIPDQVLTTSEANLRSDDEIVDINKPLVLTQDTTRINAAGGQWNNLDGLLRLRQVDATLERTPN